MSKKATVIVIAISCIPLLTVAGTNEVGEQEFQVGSGGELILDHRAGGSVEITGTGGSTVSVSYEMKCTPGCTIEFEDDGDRLKIMTRFTKPTRSQNSEVELQIEVPRRFDVKLDSSGGGLSMDGVEGTFTGKTMGGEIDLHDVRGEAKLTTMGGTIEVDEAHEGADVHTMGGNIEIGDADRFVRAKTMGGDIHIDSIDGWVEATTMGGDVDVTVTGSGGDVKLVSMSGDITLHVPSGFSMELDLEIAYTRNSQQDYKIETPYDLLHSVTDDWDRGSGTARKYIRAKGSTGGANSVRIETVNGNVTVVEGR